MRTRRSIVAVVAVVTGAAASAQSGVALNEPLVGRQVFPTNTPSVVRR